MLALLSKVNLVKRKDRGQFFSETVIIFSWCLQVFFCFLLLGVVYGVFFQDWGDFAPSFSIENIVPRAVITLLFGLFIYGVYIVPIVVVLAHILVALIAIGRYHDRDKSGYWSLLVCVPIIGIIAVLVECLFFAGTPGVNKYDNTSLSDGYHSPAEVPRPE